MRHFFTKRLPPFDRVLLVESGSRFLFDGMLPDMPKWHGEHITVDLVTCFPGTPQGFRPDHGKVFRVTDYPGRARRRVLYRELAQRRHTVMVLICSGEPIMTKWKWSLAARTPAKVMVLNENGDYFWLDIGHLPAIRQFILTRAGLAGAGAVRTLGRLLLFPLTLSYLLLYAAVAHFRRKLRLIRAAKGAAPH